MRRRHAAGPLTARVTRALLVLSTVQKDVDVAALTRSANHPREMKKMKNDPFAPSAAIRLVDKVFGFEKFLKPLPTGLEWLAALDAKLGLDKTESKLDRMLARERRALGLMK